MYHIHTGKHTEHVQHVGNTDNPGLCLKNCDHQDQMKLTQLGQIMPAGKLAGIGPGTSRMYPGVAPLDVSMRIFFLIALAVAG